jgi:hypothetical protein
VAMQQQLKKLHSNLEEAAPSFASYPSTEAAPHAQLATVRDDVSHRREIASYATFSAPPDEAVISKPVVVLATPLPVQCEDGPPLLRIALHACFSSIAGAVTIASGTTTVAGIGYGHARPRR